MTDTLAPGDVVTVPVKSKYLSKTNITAALLAVFGLLVAVGKLPESLAGPTVVGGLVTAGAVLVAYFRTFTRTVLA